MIAKCLAIAAYHFELSKLQVQLDSQKAVTKKE